MLDDKNILAAKGPDDNFLIWPRNQSIWVGVYLGKLFGEANAPIAAATRSENLEPSKALIIVGDQTYLFKKHYLCIGAN